MKAHFFCECVGHGPKRRTFTRARRWGTAALGGGWFFEAVARGDRYGHGMEWLELESSEVTEYGSQRVRMGEAARLEKVDAVAVHLARIGPGGTLGRHLTRLWQLFAVTSGTGWVAGSDGIRHAIASGEAVVWRPGEEHESGSDEGMSVVITQSTARLPREA